MIIDQFLSILLPQGDGIADSARAIRDYLIRAGHLCKIYVYREIPETAKETLPLESYAFPSDGVLLVHYSDACLIDFVVRHRLPIYLLFHNVTPDQFFAGYNLETRMAMFIARARLRELVPFTLYAVGNSRYSQIELQQLGFARTGTFPLDIARRFQNVQPDLDLLSSLWRQQFLLFVGRLTPNKRQEDLIQLLSACRQLDPRWELVLVGGEADERYARRLRRLAETLELAMHVRFVGHVTQGELVAYYQRASVFVSMSEHEGFGIPLVESMLHGLPVVAYDSTAVAEVVESAGILIRHKRLAEWVIVIERLMRDNTLRQRVVEAQNARVLAYSMARWEQAWREILGL